MLIIEEYKAKNELAFNEYLTDVKSTEDLHQRDMYIIDSMLSDMKRKECLYGLIEDISKQGITVDKEKCRCRCKVKDI